MIILTRRPFFIEWGVGKGESRLKILSVDQVPYGSNLEQNIYRHDGLLCLPKGVMLKDRELDMLRHYQVQFVQISESRVLECRTADTLDIIKSAYECCSLWDNRFGAELFVLIGKSFKKHKKVLELLNQLREADAYSFAQCLNISLVMAQLMAEGNRPDKQLGRLAFLSLVHDLGRIRMKHVLRKEGALDDSDYQELKKHPAYSYELLSDAGLPHKEISFVLQTHERWDGTGYPDKLKNEEIVPMAQMMLIADTYNALLSYRPHRKAYNPQEVLQILMEEKGRMAAGRYIDMFYDRFTPYREGVAVELNNGMTAVVKKLHPRNKLFPVVDILSETSGMAEATVDLSRHTDLYIAKILQLS